MAEVLSFMRACLPPPVPVGGGWTYPHYCATSGRWYFYNAATQHVWIMPTESGTQSDVPAVPETSPAATSLFLPLNGQQFQSSATEASISGPSLLTPVQERAAGELCNSPFIINTPGTTWSSYIPPSPYLQRPLSPVRPTQPSFSHHSRLLEETPSSQMPIPLSPEKSPMSPNEQVVSAETISSSLSLSVAVASSPSNSSEHSNKKKSAYCPASPVNPTPSWPEPTYPVSPVHSHLSSTSRWSSMLDCDSPERYCLSPKRCKTRSNRYRSKHHV